MGKDNGKGQSVDFPFCPDTLLWDLWFGRLHFPALIAADDLGLFSLLKDRPLDAEGVADALGLTPRGGKALLEVLCGLEVLHWHAGQFHLSNVATQYLLPESPFYWGGLFDAYRRAPDRFTSEKIREALLSEDAAPKTSSSWKVGELTQRQAINITRFMHAHSFPSAVALARRIDLSDSRRLLDIGAGSGCFSIAQAMQHPHLRCTLLDLPQVCEVASSYVEDYRLGDRIDFFPCNFFTDEWPRDHDVVLMSNILHDWDLETCLLLLNHAFTALCPGGRILIHEIPAGERPGDLAAATFSLHMAMGMEGRQYSASQFEKMLMDSGFTEVGFTQNIAHFWIVSAVKPR